LRFRVRVEDYPPDEHGFTGSGTTELQGRQRSRPHVFEEGFSGGYEKLKRLTPQDQRIASMYRSTNNVLQENRERLRAELPAAIVALGSATGRPNAEAV
jgi:hypothetical protein